MTNNSATSLILDERHCRICLKHGYSMCSAIQAIVPRFNVPSMAIIELWRLYGDILISKDQVYSNFICHTCYDELQNTYMFLLKCEKSEAILKEFSYYHTIKTEDEIDRTSCNQLYDTLSKNNERIENATSNQNNNIDNAYLNDNFVIMNANDDNISVDSISTIKTDDKEMIIEEVYLKGKTDQFNSKMESLANKKKSLNNTDELRCLQCPFTCLNEENLLRHNYQRHIGNILESCSENSLNSYVYVESDNVECDVKVETESENVDYVLTPLPGINPPASATKHEPSSSDATDDAKIPSEIPHFVKYIDRDGKLMKVWECGLCSRNFQHQYTLMRHLPTHTNVRNFVCNECGKAFRQLSTLSQHRAIHSVERPYACETCKKSFNRISTLISHRKTHSDVKPFRCNMCHKGFHQKGNLRNHIYIHTNERPYRCTVCNKGFNQMSNLVCHTQKSHSNQFGSMWPCHRCNMSFSKRTLLRAHELETHHIQGSSVESNRSKTRSARKTSTTSSSPDETILSESDGTSAEYCKSKISENGILIPAIKTEAMKIARINNETPFAVLHFFEGPPLLVRIIDHDNQSFLRPTQSEDFISLKSQISGQPEKVSVPIVAAVYQTLNVSGHPDFKVMPPKNIYKFINQHQIDSVNNDDQRNEIETKEIRSVEIPTGNAISSTPPQIPNDLRDVTGNLMIPLFESLHSVKDEPIDMHESNSIDLGSVEAVENKPRAIAVVEESDWWKMQNGMDYCGAFDGFPEVFQNIATGSFLAPKRILESEIIPDQNATTLDISQPSNPLLCYGELMPVTVNSAKNDKSFLNFNPVTTNNDYGNISSILAAFRNEGMDTNIIKSIFSENPNLLNDMNECLSEILPLDRN